MYSRDVLWVVGVSKGVCLGLLGWRLGWGSSLCSILSHFPWLLALSSTFKVYSTSSFSPSILFPLISWPISYYLFLFIFNFLKISVFKLLKFLLIILSINNACLASLLFLFFSFFKKISLCL